MILRGLMNKPVKIHDCRFIFGTNKAFCHAGRKLMATLN